MSVLNDPVAFRKALFGLKVERAAANLPQTATGTLFTVSVGRILLTNIVGEVTTVLGGTVTSAKLLHTPTVGTAVDLCAALAVTSKEQGTLLGITGLFSDAMVGANAGAGVAPRNPVVLPIGNLGLNTTANDTGQVKWTLLYVPLDDGATVVAA